MESPSWTSLASDATFSGKDPSEAATMWSHGLSQQADNAARQTLPAEQLDLKSSTCQSRYIFVPPVDQSSNTEPSCNLKHQEPRLSTTSVNQVLLENGRKQREKEATNKDCEVCGDVAKAKHFGGLSCNSCKAFFRRSVQKDVYLSFLCCRGKKKCVITKNNRKSCQYCRMKRCFEIGMEKRWVLTEEERKALMKARTDKKLNMLLVAETAETTDESQQSSCSSPKSENNAVHVPEVNRIGEYLSEAEIKEIQLIISKYEQAYKQVPYRQELRSFDNNRPGFQVTEMIATIVKRFAVYTRMMTQFTHLSNQDQRILLKNGVLEMCLLRGAFAFDLESNQWPNTSLEIYRDSPILILDEVRKMVSPHVLDKHVRFIRSVQQLGVDEAMIMLLTLVVLFTNRPGLSRSDCVEKSQSFYTEMLKRYTAWRFGPRCSLNVFGKLLTKLSDLRELSENHNERTLCFESDEILSIQNELRDLKISPFPEYNVLNEEREEVTSVQQQSDDSLSACAPSFDSNVKPARYSEAVSECSNNSQPLEKNPSQDERTAELASSNELHLIDAILQSIDQLIGESFHDSHEENATTVTPQNQSSGFINPHSSSLSLDADMYETNFELSGQTDES